MLRTIKWKYLAVFFIFSLVFLFPFITSPTVINGNDLNGNIVPLLYFKESLLTYHTFPLWNPYIDQGIPTIADPLYGIFNPVISIPIILFNYQIAIKAIYFLSVFFSCVTMFVLLNSFNLKQRISLIIALTYASSAYLASRIVAGHLEKIVSFAFLPLFIFYLIQTMQKRKILWTGLTAVTIALILFSGDIYNAMYCLYSLFAITLYCLIKKRQAVPFLLLSFVLFLLFSSVKILPMIQLQGNISKIKEPFSGGLNFLTFTTNLFFPFNNILLKFFQPTDLSTGFGWWESLSFIGPLSIMGIYFLIQSFFTKKWKEGISIFYILSILYVLLATPGSTLNPYYYLISAFSSLQYFHVPSRILALWSVVILTCLGIFFNSWKRKKIALMLICANLLIVLIFSQNILQIKDFYRNLTAYDAPFAWIEANNPNNYYILHGTSQSDIPHDTAFLHHMLMLQSNYGLFLRGSLAEEYNFKGLNPYTDIQPGFIVATKPIADFHLQEMKNFNGKIVYENKNTMAFATIDSHPQRAYFSPNKITITATSQRVRNLILLESSYPGWEVYIDKVKTNILPGRFLGVAALPGKHTYEFIFTSKYFLYGLLFSLISFFLWCFYIFNKRNVISKKKVKKT